MKIRFVILMIILLAYFVSAQGVESNSVFVKASTKQGELETKTVTISSKTTSEFFLRINAIEGVSLRQESLSLKEGESDIVELKFDSSGLDPGVYIGSLEVSSVNEQGSIPILFEVETEDVIFDSNIDIPPAYKEVQQGSRLTYQIKIFDLIASGGLQNSTGVVNVDVGYAVYSLDGKVLITKDDQIVVDKQAQITSAIGFPEDVEPGTYILVAAVKYKDSIGFSSQTFEITPSIQTPDNQFAPNYVIVGAIAGAVIVFFITLVVLIYLLKERDKVLAELKKYNEKETRVVMQMLREQKNVLEKKKVLRGRNLDMEINAKLKELKEKQQNRVYEIEKLKKVGSEKEMKKRLDVWRRKGYDTSALDYKIAGLTTNEMKQLLDKWKKQYGSKDKQE